MTTPEDSGRVDLLRMGPIKVLDVHTSEPSDCRVSTAVNHESVPFEKVRHLCSGKPLGRFEPPNIQS